MELLHEPTEALARRIQLVESAQTEILLQVFKVRGDALSLRFLRSLAAKSRAGVKVRMLTDGMYGRLSPDLTAELEAAGVEIRRYRRFSFLSPWKAFYRMHDKILVVDRTAVLIGGRNLEEAAFDLDPHKKLWDLEILLKGPAAETAANYFEQCWSKVDMARSFGFRVKHKQFVFLGGRDSARELYLSLAVAQREIVLCSPYFVPSRQLTGILRDARTRGVRVRIFTNSAHSSDQPLAHAAYLNSRESLARAGVEFHEARGREVLHAKCALIDDRWTFVGSFNFDPRSENLNSESLFGVQSKELHDQVLQSLEKFIGLPVVPSPSKARPFLALALRPLAGLPFIRAQL